MPLRIFGEALGETIPITVDNIPWLGLLPEVPAFCGGIGSASKIYQHF